MIFLLEENDLIERNCVGSVCVPVVSLGSQLAWPSVPLFQLLGVVSQVGETGCRAEISKALCECRACPRSLGDEKAWVRG